jgi:dTDP-4-amino-4,6-dideoxygalactose transaminase
VLLLKDGIIRIRDKLPSHFKIRVAEPNIEEEDAKAMYQAVKENRLSSGKYVEEFEKEFAKYVGVKEAVAVNSGTAAIHLPLESLNLNAGEVITTSFTFAATSNVIVLQNMKPVFVDIEPETYNLDPKKIESAITTKTKAIMPIHYGGQCAEMDEINEIASKHNLHVIEDAAPALGGIYKNRKAGTLSKISGFSFFPDKSITTGEGGMVTTNDSDLAEKCRILRKNGASKRYYHDYIGWNFRMPDPNAALGKSQLKRIEKIIKLKNEKADYYREKLQNIDGVVPPLVKNYNRHTFMLYSILTKNNSQRQKIITELNKKGIETRINFPPVHLQPVYAKRFNFKVDSLPVTEDIANRILGLPIFIKMTNEQQDIITESIKRSIGN